MNDRDAYESELLTAQLKEVQEYLQKAEEQYNEVSALVESLDEFAGLEEGSEILFPVANGILAQGTLTNTKELRVNVGQDVVVGRSVEETRALIEEQQKNLEEHQRRALERQEQLYNQLQALEKRVSEEE